MEKYDKAKHGVTTGQDLEIEDMFQGYVDSLMVGENKGSPEEPYVDEFFLPLSALRDGKLPEDGGLPVPDEIGVVEDGTERWLRFWFD